MIAYLDTSVLLKLIIEEQGSSEAERIWDAAGHLTAASLVVVEARAALAAADRAQRLTGAQHQAAKRELASLMDALAVVQVTEGLIEQAADLAEKEALRGYDAVHLAAALTVGATLMASADSALCEAAEHQGLYVANPLGS